jgi:hypothetical protein
MIHALTLPHKTEASFQQINAWQETIIGSDYFSSLVSVSFSAFDPFDPPEEQSDPSIGACYFYIGLKDPYNQDSHLTIPELRRECVRALTDCFRNKGKLERWRAAIRHF